MAKSNMENGGVIASALIPVTYEGTVLEVTKSGVKIETRDLGRQVAVVRFFAIADVIAHTNEGEGFAVVWESRPVASFYGGVVADGKIVVTLEGKREIVFNETKGAQLRVDYDANDLPSSPYAKFAKRNSDKLATAMRRLSEKASGKTAKSTGTKKKKKTAK